MSSISLLRPRLELVVVFFVAFVVLIRLIAFRPVPIEFFHIRLGPISLVAFRIVPIVGWIVSWIFGQFFVAVGGLDGTIQSFVDPIIVPIRPNRLHHVKHIIFPVRLSDFASVQQLDRPKQLVPFNRLSFYQLNIYDPSRIILLHYRAH